MLINGASVFLLETPIDQAIPPRDVVVTTSETRKMYYESSGGLWIGQQGGKGKGLPGGREGEGGEGEQGNRIDLILPYSRFFHCTYSDSAYCSSSVSMSPISLGPSLMAWVAASSACSCSITISLVCFARSFNLACRPNLLLTTSLEYSPLPGDQVRRR